MDNKWAIMKEIGCDYTETEEHIKRCIKNWLPSKKKFVTVLWIFNALLSHAVGQSLDSPPTLFTQQPIGGSTELKGNQKVLLCVANGQPMSVYRWKKDDVFITPHNVTDTSWKINGINETHAGQYQCMASNQFGAILSDRVQINVAYIKRFATGSNSEISVKQGKAAVIHLPSIDSYPRPTISWFEGSGFLISPETQRYHITLSNHLVILETRYIEDNNKQYKSKALNTFTGENMETQLFQLKVQDTGDRSSEIMPEIVIPPTHTTAVQGKDPKMVLECVANARPLNYMSLNWYRRTNGNKEVIQIDSVKYLLSFYGRKLTILNPVESDTGVYECEAVFKNGNSVPPSVSAQANITVHVKPNFRSRPPPNLNTDFGSTAVITCQALGVPIPTVKWYRNGVLLDLTDTNNRYFLKDGTDLQISDLVPEDSGMYQCFVTNQAGETNGATWLRVFSSPPDIQKPPANLSIISGDTARFPCEVTGAPRPVITWSRVVGGVEEVLPGTNSRIRVLDQELVVTSSMKADTGKYVCNATNNKGVDTAEAYLNVITRTRIINPPQDGLIIKGSTIILSCEVEHDPSVTPTWTWRHKNLIITADDRRSILGNGNLQIKSIRNEDIGMYRCNVASLGGNDAAQANITVIELPYAPAIRSRAFNPDEKRAVDLTWTPGFDGNSVILKFVVYYRIVPEGKVDQIHDDDGWIVSNNNIPASTTKYTLRSLLPARYYQFRVSAVNNVGEGQKSRPSVVIKIPEEVPSAAPQGVFGSPRSNSSIYVQWSPPPKEHFNGFLRGYNIRYKPSGYPDSTLSYEKIENQANLYELKGLIVFQEYEIAVAAYNDKGIGVYSMYVRVRTKEGVPARPPTSVTATAVNSTAIKLDWLPPDSQFINGINQGYIIEAVEVGTQLPPKKVTIPSIPSNILGRQTAFLKPLKKFTEYTLSVLCFTSEGDGPMSQPVTVRTREDVPDKVGSLRFENVLDTSLFVIWTAPENANGILTGYTLNYLKKGEPLSLISKSLGPGVHNYTVTGLTATTEYTIEVFAMTGEGNGPTSVANIKSGIPPEKPEPPSNLEVTNVQGHSVMLQFKPGFNGHTSISKWIIEGQTAPRVMKTKRAIRNNRWLHKAIQQYKRSKQISEHRRRLRRQAGGTNSEWFLVEEINDPEASTLNIQGLTPYTKYRLRITAVNIADTSNPSEPTRWFETIQAAPEVPPSDVSIRVLNETAFRVIWTPLSPEHWNGEDRGYRLEAKLTEQPFWDVIKQIPDQHANSYVLPGLEEYTGYDVRVAAYNKIGKSEFSAVVNDTTRESVPSAGPVNIQAVAINSTSIKVTWQPVAKKEQNGLITGYKIKYSSSEAGLESAFVEVPGQNNLSSNLTGLKKFVEYQVQVLASTRIGDGKLSVPHVTVKTLEDVPGPPSSVYFPEVNWESCKVVWSPPTEPNGIILGYKVSYRQQQESPNNAIENNGLNALRREYYVDKLTRDTEYMFSVAAKTSKGWGVPTQLRVRTIINRKVPNTPVAPLIARNKGDRFVTITWQQYLDDTVTGYSPIRNFTIQYQRNNDEWETVTEYVPHTETSFTIMGLKPNTPYRFRLAASNDVGRSVFSTPSLQVTTDQAAPDSPPIKLEVIPQTRTSVLVTWEHLPLSSWNSAPVGYQVYYAPIQITKAPGVTLTQYLHKAVEYPVKQLLISKMVAKTDYEVKVAAYNSKGLGVFSRPLEFYVGEAVPSAAPSDVDAVNKSSTSIEVSWTPPSVESQNGDLLGYKIFYQVTGPKNPVSSLTVGESKTSTVISGLQIYTLYNFTILPFNRAGDGPNTTDNVSAWTDEGIPGPPGPIKFAVTSLTTLNVSWAAPEESNGIITMYTVSYYQESSVGGAQTSVQVRIEDNRQYLFVSGLVAGVKYVFNVKAMTRQGFGPEATGDITTGPQEGSPAQPTQLKYTEGDSSVTLNWVNGYHGNSPIEGYIVQARERNGQAWTTLITKNTPEPEAIIPLSNLDPNTDYDFRVIAFNADSISEPSEPSPPYRTSALVGEVDPFYRQWWFLVIVALVGLIFIIVIVSVLCITGRNSKEKYKARRHPDKRMVPDANMQHYFTYPADNISRMPTTILQPSEHTNPVVMDHNEEGFATFETRRSQRRSQRGPPSSRRSDITTLPPYSRTPPRPSPSSVNYSDPDEDQKYADSNSDLTEKPSEPSDSEGDQDSQRSYSDNEDYPDLAMQGAAAGGRPNSFVNSYVNNGDVRHSWKRNAHNPAAPFNAYSYSESEGQDSSQYAQSLNGGVIMMNNMAGSRKPLPGFSSFV